MVQVKQGEEIKNATENTSNTGDEQGGKASQGGKETTQTPKTYSQQEVDVIAINVGRQLRKELAEAVNERDTLKRQAETISSEINQAKAEIEELTNLSKDDPDKMEVIAALKQWKAKLKDLGQRESVIISREAEISKRDRDHLVRKVSREYVTADGQPVDEDSFMKAADRLKVNDDEGLRSLAEEKGFKLKAATTETSDTNDDEPPPSASGRGGGIDLNKLPDEERFARAITRMRKK